MEIMLSHLGIGVAYDALDGLDIHAQRLHLRHIGVAAAVRREQADIARFFQRFAEHIPEMGGIAGQAGLGAFPNELVGSIPQFDGTRADIQRHRNIPDKQLLKGLHIRQSMDGKSRWADNIMIERWFRSLKTELIYINEFRSPRELRQSIRSYIDDYNRLRPHEALDYATPDAVYYASFRVA